jgi:hypothetical protein
LRWARRTGAVGRIRIVRRVEREGVWVAVDLGARAVGLCWWFWCRRCVCHVVCDSVCDSVSRCVTCSSVRSCCSLPQSIPSFSPSPAFTTTPCPSHSRPPSLGGMGRLTARRGLGLSGSSGRARLSASKAGMGGSVMSAREASVVAVRGRSGGAVVVVRVAVVCVAVVCAGCV